MGETYRHAIARLLENADEETLRAVYTVVQYIVLHRHRRAPARRG